MGRILIIDDQPSTQILLQSRLRDLGHEVVVADTGAKGLLESQTRPFDLFLVDLNLGAGIDGYEVCHRLKSRPQTRSVPVVLISGELTDREDLHRGYQAGCESFLLKGDFALLEDVVRAMMRIKALQDDLSLQNHLLEQQNRKLQEERQRGADLEQALRSKGGDLQGQLAESDAALLVGEDGIVRYADRGARDLFHKELEGKQLGSLVQGSGLEAFVRDARTSVRGGFKFDLAQRSGFGPGAFAAFVVPLGSSQGGLEPHLRLVLVYDERKRRLQSELVGLQEQGVPRRDLGPLLEAAARTFHAGSVLGTAPAMAELRTRIQHAAHAEHPVLITGESGTGKELIARVIHFSGPRCGPYVPVHCGALSERMLESELFGHVKGAFAEALSDRPGLLQQAHTGTIYLEEVGELPLDLQRRLLACLEVGRIRRAGSDQNEAVQVRVIASSTRDLAAAVGDGTFLAELRDRLGAVALHVPPLRQRIGDLRLLVQSFLARYGAPRDLTRISEEAVWVMEGYDWPGNIRELEGCIERAAHIARGRTIELGDLPLPLQDLGQRLASGTARSALGEGVSVGEGLPLGLPPAALPSQAGHAGDAAKGRAAAEGEETPISFEAYERKALMRALQETGNDKLEAAKLLKVGKSTLYRKLKRYGIR